jgi:NADPH2:quinone reductase
MSEAFTKAECCCNGRYKRRFRCGTPLGADEVINFREEKVEAYVERLTSGFGFDVVFDTVGGKNLTASMEAARANGRLVTTNARATIDLLMAHSKALSLHVVFMMLPLITGIGREGHGKSLRYIASLADSGHLHSLLDDEQFARETAADAHRRLQSGQTRGKVVVDLVRRHLHIQSSEGSVVRATLVTPSP